MYYVSHMNSHICLLATRALCVRMHMRMRVYLCMYVCMCVCVCVDSLACNESQPHAHIHSYVRACAYECVYVCMGMYGAYMCVYRVCEGVVVHARVCAFEYQLISNNTRRASSIFHPKHEQCHACHQGGEDP